MRVFLTGATGFIGSAIVRELKGAGHSVLALARTGAAAERLAAAGVDIHRGALEDLDSLRRGAAQAEGVIHTAFIHDFANMPAACETDLLAIKAMGDELAGSGQPFVVTSGLALLATGHAVTEDDAPDLRSAITPRAHSEFATLALAERGVRASILRLPPSVHGAGDHGFVPALIAIARQQGVSAYVNDGANRWPAVHRLDAARLYRLALEKGRAGARYHGVADTGIPTRQIATVIGERLGLPIVGKARDAALEHFGWIGNFFGIDCTASSARTQAELNWRPEQPGLLEDLAEAHYY